MGAFIAVFLCMVLGGVIVLIFRVNAVVSKAREVLNRADAVLGIIEGHGKATDAATQRVVDEVKDVKRDTVRAASVAAQARDAATAAVERVPEKVVGLLKSSEGK